MMEITTRSCRLAIITIFALCAASAVLWAGAAWCQEAADPAPEQAPAPAAQALPPAATPQPASPADRPAYRIQPGDTLGVTVLGVAEYSGSFTVRADGTILLPDDMVGPVAVGGCTEKEATNLLTARIGEYVKDPSLILTISRFKVAVVGQVKAPGQYDVSSGNRLTDAVDRAGGAKDPTRDLTRVYVQKVSGEERQYSLRDFRELGDSEQNPLLEPGDRVSVGKPLAGERGEYKVSGAVAKPGSFPLDDRDQLRVSDAVREAGRWTEDGNPRKARLVRKDGTRLTLDLTGVDMDPGSDENVVLKDGDELFVPRNALVVNVLGGVKKPGQFHVAAGTTVMEVIALAGGLEENAILSGCAIVRNEPKPTRIAVDLERLVKQGDLTHNPVVEDRDIVFVPAKPTAKGGKTALEAVTDTALRFWWVLRWF